MIYVLKNQPKMGTKLEVGVWNQTSHMDPTSQWLSVTQEGSMNKAFLPYNAQATIPSNGNKFYQCLACSKVQWVFSTID
jgi:hypothetical protein